MTSDRLEAPPGSRASRWAAVLGIWTIVGFIAASQFYLATRSIGHELSFLAVLFWELPVYYVWAPLTPLICLLARRFPLERERLALSLPVHVAGGTAASLVYLVFLVSWYDTFSPYAPQAETYWDLFWIYFRARFNMGFLFYWAIVGAYYAVTNYRRYRQREIEASEARAELARAELRALKLQLNPHFLFNALHTVASLMEDDVKAARRVLARLSELLRTALEWEGVQETPLATELRFLDEYLEIERARFGDRLEVNVDVPPEAREALVPTFVLQPLVENAIRHGVTSQERGGKVHVAAARRDGHLQLRVEDDGPGLPDPASAAGREGIGLENTRARLRQLYGDDHRFDLRAADPGGVVVEIEIPFHTDPGSPGPGREEPR